MSCNCYSYPFVPHVPCHEECKRKTLSMASRYDLENIFRIPPDIAEKISERNTEGDVLSMAAYELTATQASIVEAIFSTLDTNTAALDWLKMQYPTYEMELLV
jgi:hypothetical protein